MKFLFFITSFFLFQEFAFCQNIDSLLNVIEHKMEKQKVFDKAKENQIKRVLEGSFKTNAFEEKIRVNNELFKLIGMTAIAYICALIVFQFLK